MSTDLMMGDPYRLAKLAGDSAVVGIDTERERCLAIVTKWMRTDHMKLHAGEMTAQEVRSVKAVLGGIVAEIASRK